MTTRHISRTHHLLTLALVALSLSVGIGCGSLPSMVVDAADLPNTRTYPYAVKVEVGPLDLPEGGERLGYSLTGNYIPNPMKREDFSEALVTSLEDSGMFGSVSSEEATPYLLHVQGMSVKIPAGLNMSVVVNPSWSLADDRTDFVLWREQIISEETAGLGDAFDGGRRAKLVASRAGKANITEGLIRLSYADLRPRFAASEVYFALQDSPGSRTATADSLLKEDEGGREETMLYMLSFAAKEGDNGLAHWLLKEGVDPDVVDQSLGLAPLHVAVRHGKLSTAQLLIDRGASLDIVSDEGITPLYYAHFSSHPSVWKLLLDRQADVALDVTDDNAHAAALATSDFVGYLADAGREEAAASACETGAHYYNRAAEDFERTVGEISQLINSKRYKNLLRATLANLSAYSQARINARTSLTGRGFGTAIYYVDSVEGLKELRKNYEQLAAESRSGALSCNGAE